MAIKRDYNVNETPFGLVINNAYVRVHSLVLDDLGRVTFQIDWWASRAIAKSGAGYRPWRSERRAAEGFVFNHTGTNPKSQLYAWLKTTSEFAAAVDALE